MLPDTPSRDAPVRPLLAEQGLAGQGVPGQDVAEHGVGVDSPPTDRAQVLTARAALARLLWIIPPLVAGIVAFALAQATLLPGVGFWDTGEFQTVGPVLGTAHPTGFPSYVVLGWLASVLLQPIGEPAFRMNVLSAILGAVTAGLTALLVQRLTARPWLALAAGVALAMTPIVWRISNHADPHALHLTLVALLLLFLVMWHQERRAVAPSANRWLIAAAVTYGVAVANHSLALLFAPGIGLYVLSVDWRIWRRGRLVLACALAVVATAALFYLELPLRAGIFRAPLVYAKPDTWDGFVYVVLAEQFRGSLVDPLGDLGGKVATVWQLASSQLGWLAPVVPIAFLATLWRQPRYALLTGLTAFITCWFAASYVNADIDRYYLGPALIAVTWLAVLADTLVSAVGRGLGSIFGRALRRPVLAVGLATLVAEGILAVALAAPGVAAVPDHRADVDLSRDTLATRWLDAALEQMAPNAVVVSWWSYSTPLWYAQRVEGRRPDITIIDDRTRLDEQLGDVSSVIDHYLPTRPIYLIRNPSELARIETQYQVEPIITPTNNPVVRVVGPRAQP